MACARSRSGYLTTKWRGVHNGFAIRAEDFMSSYQRVWSELAEWDYDQRQNGAMDNPGSLPAPARTEEFTTESQRTQGRPKRELKSFSAFVFPVSSVTLW